MNLIWDSTEKTIRGSFVNLVITFAILILICIGCYNKEFGLNLKELSSLIIGFFTVSFGVWKVSNVVETINSK